MNSTDIAISEVIALLNKAWQKIVPPEQAKIITEAIVRTALQKDERINPIKEGLDDLKKAFGCRPQIKELPGKGAVKAYDLCGTPGIVYMPVLIDQLIKLAKDQGIALISIKNSGGVHTLSSWLLEMTQKDCIGLFAWNGGSFTTVPYGSREPFFGTNPIAYAIPTLEDPILLDMATSEIPFMNLLKAIRSNSTIPEKAGLDETGTPTREANRAYDIQADTDVRLLPMGGGYKGSAIMLLLEIMTGALINSKMSREATSATFIPEEFGGVLMAIDISTFTSLVLFKQKVSDMLKQIRSSKPAAGFTTINIPGDKGFARERSHHQTGTISLDCALIEELKKMSQ